MSNVKFKAIYTGECSRRANNWGGIYSAFLSFATASSVSAWAIWQKAPWIWTSIVYVAQFLHLLKPYFPFLKHGMVFREMSLKYDALYLDYE